MLYPSQFKRAAKKYKTKNQRKRDFIRDNHLLIVSDESAGFLFDPPPDLNKLVSELINFPVYPPRINYPKNCRLDMKVDDCKKLIYPQFLLDSGCEFLYLTSVKGGVRKTTGQIIFAK